MRFHFLHPLWGLGSRRPFQTLGVTTLDICIVIFLYARNEASLMISYILRVLRVHKRGKKVPATEAIQPYAVAGSMRFFLFFSLDFLGM